jgi:hypothetical protein
VYNKVNNNTKTNKKMENQMTRKEAASIMKKYEVNGMIFTKGTFPKEEYFIAKRIWNQIVNQD